jgi:ligand-binding sensor domain-containing protein
MNTMENRVQSTNLRSKSTSIGVVPLWLVIACFATVSSAPRFTAAQELAGPPAPQIWILDQPPQISAYIREVFQDRDGDFWFGTNGDGICRYDGKTLTYLSVKEGFGGSAVRGILQDDGGAMWFATDGGVSRYESGIFTNYTVADGLSDHSVWSLMRDRSGTIWAGTHRGVCRFDGTSFVPFPLPRVEVENPSSRFTPKVVFCMFEDQTGHLWFGTDGEGVHRYDGDSFTSFAVKDGLAGNQVRCIQGDRRGKIWIGTNGGGVSCYDGTSFRNFTKKDGLNNDRVYEIFEDQTGHLWFSTLGAGACRYDGTTFTAFGADQGLTINELPCPCGSGSMYASCHGPNGAHVQEMFQDKDGVLWFGCSGGLFRLDGEKLVNVTRDGPWPEPS